MIIIEKKYSTGIVKKEVTPEEWARLKALPKCHGWKEVVVSGDNPSRNRSRDK